MLRYSRFLFLKIQVYWHSIIAAKQNNSLDMFMVLYACGNYSVVLVQNISECYCCEELEPCGQSLESAGDWSEQAAFWIAIASLIA